MEGSLLGKFGFKGLDFPYFFTVILIVSIAFFNRDFYPGVVSLKVFFPEGAGAVYVLIPNGFDKLLKMCFDGFCRFGRLRKTRSK